MSRTISNDASTCHWASWESNFTEVPNVGSTRARLAPSPVSEKPSPQVFESALPAVPAMSPTTTGRDEPRSRSYRPTRPRAATSANIREVIRAG